jgi:DMSO/TMAO reductase YedYZ molybdopterin-dependent catalytic subunit
MNPPGAGLIENVKITGIPLEYVLEKAGGVKPGATAVFPTDSGGYTYPITLEHLKKHQAYLVYEINGRRLSTVHGYPVQLWVDGMGAQTFVKQLSEIRVSSEPVEGMHLYRGWTREQGGYFNKPNLAIFKLKDGQIVQAGIPFTFEGYADAFDESIAGIEISMDRCKTWTRYETTGAATDRWVYWYYTFTPTEPGAYIICVRAVTEKGLASDKPVMLLVNARRQ